MKAKFNRKSSILTILITSMILLVILSACSSTDNSTAGINKPSQKKATDCESKAAQLIPKTVWLMKQASLEDPYPFAIKTFTNNWTDGDPIRGGDQYRKGDKTGENTNYYYPEFWNSQANLVAPGLAYKGGEATDQNGAILGDNAFRADLVVKPIPNTEKSYIETAGKNVTNQLFEVVEYKIFQCTLFNVESQLNPNING